MALDPEQMSFLKPIPNREEPVSRGKLLRAWSNPSQKPSQKSGPSVWSSSTTADRIGICLSALCIVHCLMTPVLLILLPTLQFFFLREEFHAYLAVIIPLTCLAAFIPGYRSHGDKKIFLWSGSGLAFIISALFVPHTNSAIWFESFLSVVGGACLIRAHVLNRRLCACCAVQHLH